MDRHRAAACLALIAAVATGCPGATGPAAQPSLGEKRAAGAVRWLGATADGAWLAWLEGCAEARAQSLPAGTANCDLRAVPAAGGEPVRVARAVSTLPGAVAFAPAGAELAALADYDYAAAGGTLVRFRPGAAPAELAKGVTFHGYGPDGSLGFLAGGELWLAPPGGEPARVRGATSAASFELGPKGSDLWALVRRKAGAGGELLAVRRGGAEAAAAPIAGAAPAGDYAFAPERRLAVTRLGKDGGELLVGEARAGAAPEPVGRAVRAFAFAPSGDALAYLADAAPGKQGTLRVRAGGRDVALGKEVGELRWAARASRLAWLEEYDPRVRSGALGVGGPDLAPRTLGKNVSDLELSADGRWVAFLQHSTRGGYTVDLLLAALDAPAGAAPRRVAQGSYGFAFSPDGRWLYYRTGCTRNGEACDLERIDPAAPAAAPERIADGVKSFEFAPGDPGRLLVTWKRMDRDALDIGVWAGGKVTTLDTYALPGSARFLGPQGDRVAYAVIHEKRPGVYVAPGLPAGQAGK